eukprot:GHRR01013427.1.p3 GENE.GHRR01013427.1~~GHRR01013427.1.p3  ORF type:complete len:107 (+),score=14.62 GHRR01013427.1:641-961(+)
MGTYRWPRVPASSQWQKGPCYVVAGSNHTIAMPMCIAIVPQLSAGWSVAHIGYNYMTLYTTIHFLDHSKVATTALGVAYTALAKFFASFCNSNPGLDVHVATPLRP